MIEPASPADFSSGLIEPRPDAAVLELAFPDMEARCLLTTHRLGDVRLEHSPPRRAAESLTGGLPWRWTRQMHGAAVAVGGGPGARADALVALPDDPTPLAVFAADCALLAIASPEGVRAAVHIGWSGLVAGVIEAAAEAMRTAGATRLAAWRSPCVHPECYEFGPLDLERVAARYGDAVRSRTPAGRVALDLPAAVRLAAARAGVELVGEVGTCTACAETKAGEPLWFSHRARQDSGRHALVVLAAR